MGVRSAGEEGRFFQRARVRRAGGNDGCRPHGGSADRVHS